MRVILEQPILDEFFELISNSKKFINWTNLSERLSCSCRTLGHIRHNKRTFPKKVFEELLEFVPCREQTYFLSKATYLDVVCGIEVRWYRKLTKLRQKLEEKNSAYHLELKARLCGYLAGDGMVSCRSNAPYTSNRYEIKFFPDDLQMVESFNEAFQELYDRKLKIEKNLNQNYYILRATHKIAYLDLIKIAKFGTHAWRVPFNFLNTKLMKVEWLRAFFDCESYVGKNKIQVQSVNKGGMQDVKVLLESLGIEASKIYKYERRQKNWNVNYLLEIRKKDNLKNYLKLIGFNHSIKQGTLESQLAGVAESG